MKRSISISAVSLSIFMLILISFGCKGNSLKPDEKDISQAFFAYLPAFLELTSFDLVASENVGSKVKPVYKSRFNAIIKIRQDTFEAEKLFKDVAIVKRVKKAGEKITVYGISTSTLSEGKWKTKFRLERNYFNEIGMTLGSFKKSRIIVKGTPEEEGYYKELEKKEEEKRKARIRELKKKVISMIENKNKINGQIYLTDYFKDSTGPSFVLVFENYNPKTDTFNGTMTWLNQIHTFGNNWIIKVFVEGKLIEKHIYLKEIKYLNKGEKKYNPWREMFGLGLEYSFEFDKINLRKYNGEWYGKWEKDNYNGKARLWHLFGR